MHILNRMKVVSLIILICMCLTGLSPVTGMHTSSGPHRAASILTLDVCKTYGAASVQGPDMPLILEQPGTILTPGPASSYTYPYVSAEPFILAFNKERPPKFS